MSEGYDLRPYRRGDEEEILPAFNRIFREVCGEGYVDRTIDQWRWEFERNPCGQRSVMAWTSDGEIAGHFGGVPVAMHTARGPATFVQGVDNFVFAEHRRGLARPGLFVALGRAWQAHCREQGTEVIYGYPVIAAQRAGSKFLRYVPIWIVEYLVRDTGRGDATPPAGIEVEAVDELPAETDALFEEFAIPHTCLVRRDRRYLQWRYVDHAGIDYVILAARRAGRLVGLGVLHPQHELIPGCCTIVDWVVPGADAEVVSGLVARVTEIARERGRSRVMAAFAPWSAERAAFLERGFAAESSALYLERRLNHILADPTWTADWVRDNWWHTLGDSDFA